MAEMENQLYLMSTMNVNSTADLDRVDFSKANAYFKQALVNDPANLDANIGAGLSEVFMVYADASVNDAIKRWEEFDPGSGAASSALLHFGLPTGTKDMSVPLAGLGRDLVKIIQQAKTDPPSISEMQTLLKTKFLPRIDYALARMAVIEQHPDYQLKITGKMQGNLNASPVYMDLTEIYLLDAVLNGLKATVSQFLVFQFTLPSYTNKDVMQAINQNNTTFFVLASDGKAQAANVKNGLLGVITKIRNGINFLKNETDAQSDDIIKLKVSGGDGVSSADLDSVLVYLQQAESAINTGYTINIKNADSDGNDYTLQVNLNNFFSNPPANPKKDWLPPYTVDTSAHGDIIVRWTQQTYATFMFPDPTLGGIFPNMTNDMLKRLLQIDEEFAWRVYLNATNFDQAALSTMNARLQVGATSYFPKHNDWDYYGWYNKEFKFFVTDQVSGTAKVFVTINGIERELTLSSPADVKPKQETYISASVTLAPQNLTVKLDSGYISYPVYGNATFIKISYEAVQGAYYNNYFTIERDSTSTGFLPYDKQYFHSEYQNSNYYYYYQDLKFTGKKTYKYRISPANSDYYWGIQGYLQNNYSNTVTITTP